MRDLFYEADKLHEECGVFGIYSHKDDVALNTYWGLFALQHRGQESAGIIVSDGQNVHVKKNMGLVSDVFKSGLEGLDGYIGIGHVRYSTTGSSMTYNVQPLKVFYDGGNLCLSHNGNLTNAASLRQELAKSSVKKYTTMQTVVGSDDRARGLIQFYGANRTGRYAGRLIQVQNLPQNHLPDLDTARALVRSGNTDAVEMLYDSVPLVLSELIRTAFVPKPGCRFYVADFSAIEARVIAWIAGEHWRQEVFAKGGDIYCASASQMFHVPVEKHGVNGHLRQKGKIAELALGYGGSVGALKAMGALNYGLQEEELKPLVDAWRLSNPHITKFWWDVDKAASTCVRERTATETHGIRFYYQSGMMFVVLPSGRRLVYVKPKMGLNRFGNESVTYEGVGEQKKWLRLESYGPKFVENIVQATARDILAEAMLRLNAAGYRIVMHIHDEAVIEAPPDTSLENICSVMGQTPTWASGLLLRADGYVCDFYKKD